jgi:disease resistance protein RPM1
MFDDLLHFNWKASTKLLDRLGEFKLLRVLDLEDCKALKDKHMKHICHMYMLKYLGLRGTRISVMPSKIGNLEYLETLDVEMTGIKDLPPTMTKLSKLERLRVNQWVLTRG